MTETVYIGSKPVINYVTALATALNKSGEVEIKARGRAISTAVDVYEVTRRSFIRDLEVMGIDLGTERLGDPGEERNVSTITIRVEKP
mgnify:CR=1 FL=1